MGPAFVLESTLTDRYQTTVPEAVRLALKLGKRDRIQYTVQPNGQIIITRAETHDPALDAFLTFLARDMTEHPQNIQSIDEGFKQRILSAVSDIVVELDTELSDHDE